MSEINTEINEKIRKNTKCDFQCNTCHYYSKKNDFCKELEIKNCSEYVRTNFSKCDNYLIDSKLVMF